MKAKYYLYQPANTIRGVFTVGQDPKSVKQDIKIILNVFLVQVFVLGCQVQNHVLPESVT